MKSGLRRRFYPETVMGVITAVMFLVTLVQRDWMEALFGVDPDNHSGALELLIVGGLLLVTVAMFSLATYEWRRADAMSA